MLPAAERPVWRFVTDPQLARRSGGRRVIGLFLVTSPPLHLDLSFLVAVLQDEAQVTTAAKRQ